MYDKDYELMQEENQEYLNQEYLKSLKEEQSKEHKKIKDLEYEKMKEESYNKFLDEIISKQEKNEDYQHYHYINGVKYELQIKCPDETKGIYIPSIIAIPVGVKNATIALEANNKESDEYKDRLSQALETAEKLATFTQDPPSIVVIPIIPSKGEEKPYYQQLSRDCFSEQKEEPNIDEQVVNIIEEVKNIEMKNKTIVKDVINIPDKIFINGYSSSGVFAQRFALLHPELIQAACIGGASGSIPYPTMDLPYPLGIKDYKEITGKDFDSDSYNQIKFNYYVGEFEGLDKIKREKDKEEKTVPMHDMSYFERSIPKEVGEELRNKFGEDLITRAEKEVMMLQANGANISHSVIEGKAHSSISAKAINNDEGIEVEGVSLEDQKKFIQTTYVMCNEELSKEKTNSTHKL